MKIGIIGCGWAFEIYMETWGRHPHLEIAGVADLNPVRLGVVSRHYNIRPYQSNEALLADPDVAIVVNLTPPPRPLRGNERIAGSRQARLFREAGYYESRAGTRAV